MPKNILLYWIGNIGISGKGANYSIPYNPNTTIGDIIANIPLCCKSQNTRIEILKFQKGNINKYDINNPYWSHETKLSDYLAYYSSFGDDLQVIYCLI